MYIELHAKNLEGVIVVLSDEGRLEACYLGAEPSLFIAPPLHHRGFDYKAAEKELLELRKHSRNSASSGNYFAILYFGSRDFFFLLLIMGARDQCAAPSLIILNISFGKIPTMLLLMFSLRNYILQMIKLPIRLSSRSFSLTLMFQRISKLVRTRNRTKTPKDDIWCVASVWTFRRTRHSEMFRSTSKLQSHSSLLTNFTHSRHSVSDRWRDLYGGSWINRLRKKSLWKNRATAESSRENSSEKWN